MAQLSTLGVAAHFMNTRYILLAVLASTATLFAALVGAPYDNSNPPDISLPAAYALATTALGSATNQFYCVGATLSAHVPSIHIPSGAGWCFTFRTTNQPPQSKWVGVSLDGTVHVDDSFDGGLL